MAIAKRAFNVLGEILEGLNSSEGAIGVQPCAKSMNFSWSN